MKQLQFTSQAMSPLLPPLENYLEISWPNGVYLVN